MASDRSSSSRSEMIGVCLFVVTFALNVPGSHGVIPTLSCLVATLQEDAPIGTNLTVLEGKVFADSGGTFPNLTFGIADTSTAALVNLSQAVQINTDTWRSSVELIGELDADNGQRFRNLRFLALDSNGNKNNVICQLIITDVNDNAPSFQGLPYVIRATENTTVGTLLLPLTATDPDTRGSPCTVHPKFSDQEVDAVFDTSERAVNINTVVMNISLAQLLDYEARSFYTFELFAVDDDGLNSTAMVTVFVVDVQDTPPIFLLDSYRAAIPENEPEGTYVIKVSAEDGDRDPPNDISYSIVSGNTDYFTINNVTGEITSLVVLDRDNATMVGSEGFFQLVVRASEIPGDTPQYGNTTTDVTVVVVVEDANDNRPTFGSSAPYTAFVREDVAARSLIYFAGDGYISVSDADQGRNSHFNLTVERDGLPWLALEATPSEVYSEALILLRVMDADVFRNSAGTHITLQLVAREVSTDERFSSTAEVVITVEKSEEPPTTPLPIVDNSTTASDVVVFIIGFLVVFNIAATVFIVWFLRRGSKEPRQGLVRKGSKYYVNGVETNVRGSSGFQNGSAVTLRPESIMVELEGKDRCDVVPLSAMLTDGKRISQVSSALSNSLQRSSTGLSYDTLDSGNTERKVLVANEVSPATKSGGPAPAKPKIVITKADVSSSAAEPPATTTATTTTTSSTPLPDFSMAKRNVSAPQNPSLSFTKPTVTTAASSNTSSFQLATTAFPSTNASSQATTTTTSSSPEAATMSTTVEPVTTFSAKGVVCTTVTAVPDYVTVSPATGSGNDAGAQASPKPGESESMSEILY